MFRYIEHKNKTFLFGAYRGEKCQLDWILGEKTQRYEKLYNIRFNKDLFSTRNGGRGCWCGRCYGRLDPSVLASGYENRSDRCGSRSGGSDV